MRKLLLALFWYSAMMCGQLVTVTETLLDSQGASAVGYMYIQNPPFLSPQGTAVAITGASNATPIVITSVGHGFVDGQTVYVTGVGGNTAANGTWVINQLTVDTFELNGSVGNGAYTAGGTAQRVILVAGDRKRYPTSGNFTGTVTVSLYPTTNAIAIPGGAAAGFTYLVEYRMATTAISTQRWNVPTSGPVSIQSVVTPGTTTPTATVALSQLGQDGATGTLTEDLRWTGARWDNTTLFDSTVGLSHGTAAAGSSTEAARDTHVHPVTPAAAAGFDWGSATLPWKDFYIAGSSGTPGTNNTRITGTFTAARVFTLPDAASNPVRPDTGTAKNFLTAIASTGIISKAQPAPSDLSGGTDDSTLVGNGTDFEVKAIPDCDDSLGQHLNYDTATNAFSCGTTALSRTSSFCSGTATSSATLFLTLWPAGACTNTTEGVATELLVSSAGKLRNLRVKAGTAGFAAGSGAVTLRVNGSSSIVTCTVGTGTTCFDTVNTATVAAGDRITVQVVTQATETLADLQVAWEY